MFLLDTVKCELADTIYEDSRIGNLPTDIERVHFIFLEQKIPQYINKVHGINVKVECLKRYWREAGEASMFVVLMQVTWYANTREEAHRVFNFNTDLEEVLTLYGNHKEVRFVNRMNQVYAYIQSWM